jgi:hypothetical protein
MCTDGIETKHVAARICGDYRFIQGSDHEGAIVIFQGNMSKSSPKLVSLHWPKHRRHVRALLISTRRAIHQTLQAFQNYRDTELPRNVPEYLGTQTIMSVS